MGVLTESTPLAKVASLITLLIIIFVCVALFRLIRRSGGPHHHWGPWHMMDRGPGHWADPTSSALQILNERFAKGEIQKAEYEDKKAAILSGWQR